MNKRTEQHNGYEYVEDFSDMHVEHIRDDVFADRAEHPVDVTHEEQPEEVPNLSSEPDAGDVEYPEDYQQEFSPIFGYEIIEVAGALEMQNGGQVISSFIAEDDKSSFYSAVQDAHEFGRGVWTYEDTTGSHAAIFVRGEPNDDGALTYEWHSYVREPVVEIKEIQEPEEVQETEIVLEAELVVTPETQIPTTESFVVTDIATDTQKPTSSPTVGYSERSFHTPEHDEYAADDEASEIDTVIDAVSEEVFRGDGDVDDDVHEVSTEPSAVHSYEPLYAFFEETLQRQAATRSEHANSPDSKVQAEDIPSVESQIRTIDATSPEINIPERTRIEAFITEDVSPETEITLAEHREASIGERVPTAERSLESVHSVSARSSDDEPSAASSAESFTTTESSQTAEFSELTESENSTDSHTVVESREFRATSAETRQSVETAQSIESFDEPIESITFIELDNHEIEDSVDVSATQITPAQAVATRATAAQSFESTAPNEDGFSDHTPEPQPSSPDDHPESFASQNQRTGIETGISLVMQENRVVTISEQTVEDFTQVTDLNQRSEKEFAANTHEHRSAPERVIPNRDSIEQAFAETGIRLVTRTRETNESGRAVTPSRIIPIAAQTTQSAPATTKLSGAAVSAKAA